MTHRVDHTPPMPVIMVLMEIVWVARAIVLITRYLNLCQRDVDTWYDAFSGDRYLYHILTRINYALIE